MKVLDLIENNEWTSNPSTLEHLFKKQLSATHAFIIEIQKLLKTHPTQLNLLAISQWEMFEQTPLEQTPSGRIVSELSVEDLDPKLQIKFDRMIDAKNAHQKAGGKYESS